jgi:hypothetical protein
MPQGGAKKFLLQHGTALFQFRSVFHSRCRLTASERVQKDHILGNQGEDSCCKTVPFPLNSTGIYISKKYSGGGKHHEA